MDMTGLKLPGLVPQSALPQLEAWLVQVFFSTLQPGLVWLVWRPALYAYVLGITLLLSAQRRRSWRYLLLGLPALFTLMPYLVLPISPDFRYYYPVYLSCVLVCLPLWLLPRRVSPPPALDPG
jgi:hypothetical protein